ncbi:MAG: ribonuclease R [Planctomycetota bacterium]
MESGKDRNGGSGGFGSFKDLGRALGGKREEPQPDEGRGWHVEDGSEHVDTSDLEDALEPERRTHDRVGSRPRAFGPMEHGPEAYRDEESEEMQLLHSFRVRTVFPDDVRREVESLPADPRDADLEDRVDLRGRTIYTIDGDDAKDYDDAIEIARLPNGNVELGVHIADVSHYVRPGTALDDEALARATSVYLPDQVVPMLPEQLSNGLCSLVPERDRLAYSVYAEFDDAGRRVATRVHKSVIRSVRRNTYAEVQRHLDGDRAPELAGLEPLSESLLLLDRWTAKQQEIRDAKGSLRIQSTEQKVLFDDAGHVAGFADAQRHRSMTLIEETALAANQCVGDFFRERGLPTIYRVHPEKDPEEIAEVAKALEKHGIRVPEKERLTGRDVGRLIRAARRKANAEALIGRIMGLVERAYYEVKDHEDVAVHWGLAREAYLHFTSPIRRYPDLVVHRWMHALQSRGDEAVAELRADAFVEDLNQVAGHSSVQADTAEMASTAVFDLKVCQYMEPHVGESLEAKVTRVSRAGLEVRLVDHNVSGFLPGKALGDRVRVEGPTLTATRGRRFLSFTEGHAIAVRVKDVDFLRLQVLLALANG